MARRVLVTLLGPVRWAPPGTDPIRWQAALAEDVVDLIATLSEVEPAIAATAAQRTLADAVAWPGMPIYDLPARTVGAALAAAAADGYDQAAVIVADAPDLPGLILGKLLRPLSSRSVAVAPATPAGPGLLGLAARLPAPDWLADDRPGHRGRRRAPGRRAEPRRGGGDPGLAPPARPGRAGHPRPGGRGLGDHPRAPLRPLTEAERASRRAQAFLSPGWSGPSAWSPPSVRSPPSGAPGWVKSNSSSSSRSS